MLTMYSKPSCPKCLQAKMWLDSHGVEYAVVDVSADAEALRFIKEEHGHRTVPQFYKNGELVVVGGCDGLIALGIEKLLERIG